MIPPGERRYDRGGQHSHELHHEVTTSVFERVRRHVENGLSTLIIGGRRIGKSTLLGQLERNFNSVSAQAVSRRIVVALDLEELDGAVEEVLFHRLTKRWRESVNQVATALGIPITRRTRLPTRVSYEHFRTEVTGTLDEFATFGSFRALVLLDECERLLDCTSPSIVLGNLRALTGLATGSRLQLVVSGFRDLHEFRDPETGTSPLKNVLELELLGALEAEAFDRLLEPFLTRFPGDPVRRESVARQLCDASGRHPAIAQCLCALLESGEASDVPDACRIAEPIFEDRMFTTLLDAFRDPDRAKFRELLRSPDLEIDDSRDDLADFLVSTGLVLRDGRRLRAKCGMFNEWYRRRSAVTSPPSMMADQNDFLIPNDLIECAQEHRLAAFVGSGLSRSADVIGNFPSWTGTFERLMEIAIGNSTERQRQDDLRAELQSFRQQASRLNVQQFIARFDSVHAVLGDGYGRAMESIFDPPGSQFGDVHRALVSLDLRIWLTTNYDRLLEAAEPAPRRDAYVPRESALVYSRAENLNRRILFKIHGCASRNDFVLTTAEYMNLANDSAYQSILDHLFKTRSFLFVGFGMNDPLDLDLALDRVTDVLGPQRRKHWVLLPRGECDSRRDELIRRFNVHAIPIELHSDVAPWLRNLRSRFATNLTTPA